MAAASLTALKSSTIHRQSCHINQLFRASQICCSFLFLSPPRKATGLKIPFQGVSRAVENQKEIRNRNENERECRF
jgi:hypothetical protein